MQLKSILCLIFLHCLGFFCQQSFAQENCGILFQGSPVITGPELKLIGDHVDLDTMKVKQVDSVYLPFNNLSTRASIYQLSIQEGRGSIELIIPTKYQSKAYFEALIAIIRKLPISRIESLSAIRLNLEPYQFAKRVSYSTFMSTSSDGVVDIYPLSLEGGPDYLAQIHVSAFRHELGHAIATLIFGGFAPSEAYRAAAARDGVEVSGNGSISLAEDFAEAIRFYLDSDGGRLDPELRRKLAHRFHFIDQVFKYSRNPQSLPLDEAASISKQDLR